FQIANCLPKCRHIVAICLDKLGRQSRLIDQPQVAVDAADPAQRRNYLASLRRAHVEANLRETGMPNVSATARFVTSPSIMFTAAAIGGNSRAARSMPRLASSRAQGSVTL